MTNQRISMNLPTREYPHSTALKPSVKNLSRTPDTDLGIRIFRAALALSPICIVLWVLFIEALKWWFLSAHK